MWTHGVIGMTLCEAYGLTSSEQSERASRAINNALAYTREIQQTPKLFPSYHGGWCYRDRDDKVVRENIDDLVQQEPEGLVPQWMPDIRQVLITWEPGTTG